MTTALPAAIESHRHSIAEITKSIRQAVDLEHLTEARARIEALRAWARVHGQVKHLRVDLLRIEVEALVRVVELGGESSLSGVDRKAGRWLAGLGYNARLRMIEKATKATTAVGMCRAVWRETEIAAKRDEARSRGVYLTQNPDPPGDAADSVFEADARRHRRRIGSLLSDVAEQLGASVGYYTSSELAERILSEAGLEGSDDPDVLAGVKQVCERAIRSAPPLLIDGTEIPRVITARNGEKFARIPTMTATVAHFDDMLALRREQISADLAEHERLSRVADRLRAVAAGREGMRIGDLISETLKAGC